MRWQTQFCDHKVVCESWWDAESLDLRVPWHALTFVALVCSPLSCTHIVYTYFGHWLGAQRWPRMKPRFGESLSTIAQWYCSKSSHVLEAVGNQSWQVFALILRFFQWPECALVQDCKKAFPEGCEGGVKAWMRASCGFSFWASLGRMLLDKFLHNYNSMISFWSDGLCYMNAIKSHGQWPLTLMALLEL